MIPLTQLRKEIREAVENEDAWIYAPHASKKLSKEDVARLLAALDKAEEALEFYATPYNTPFVTETIVDGVASVQCANVSKVGQYWERARDALAAMMDNL